MMAKFIDLNLGASRFSNVDIPRTDPLALLFPGMFFLLMFPGSRNVIRVPNVAGLPSQTQISPPGPCPHGAGCPSVTSLLNRAWSPRKPWHGKHCLATERENSNIISYTHRL